MNKYMKQMFDGETTETTFESYCDFDSSVAKAIAGKDWLLAIWDSTGETLLAVAGQKSLTINRSAESIEVNSKDTEGGWKAKLAGMKEWSIDTDGLYVTDDDSHEALSAAFENGDFVCVKVCDIKHKKGKFGGLAVITDYPLEAPFDDAVTYTIKLEGVGKLTDLTNHTGSDVMPEGYDD